jgi:uncharacterized membrane protein YqiK
MDGWMVIVGAVVAALSAALAFLAWAVFKVGDEPNEPLVEYERWIAGPDVR